MSNINCNVIGYDECAGMKSTMPQALYVKTFVVRDGRYKQVDFFFPRIMDEEETEYLMDDACDIAESDGLGKADDDYVVVAYCAYTNLAQRARFYGADGTLREIVGKELPTSLVID